MFYVTRNSSGPNLCSETPVVIHVTHVLFVSKPLYEYDMPLHYSIEKLHMMITWNSSTLQFS